MPELPDVAVYIEALEHRIAGRVLETVRIRGPFLLRTVDPPVASVHGRRVERLRRVGKRIAIGLDGDVWLVIHLMIAGRLHWRKRGAPLGGRQMLAGFDFENGTLVLTEAGSDVAPDCSSSRGRGTPETRRGGLEVLDASLDEFAASFVYATTR